jgi:DNA-binding NarL/FixJ family response regulator
VVGEAADGRAALALSQEMSPDVVIMDVAMPNLNGIEATRRIIASAPSTKVIALSMYVDRRFIQGMLEAGASGYLPKDCAFDELILAIRAVAANQSYLGSTIMDIVGKGYQRHFASKVPISPVLSSREREVLQLLAEGRTVKDIAHELKLSVKTIETHRNHISRKLNTNSMAELTKYAVREGLTSLDK